ncbi:MAG: hypothetical protein HY081_09380 [Gammaproteobacteria bacterium]|nr:hypothetical protein [Gammaproteobacteria bacterium]
MKLPLILLMAGIFLSACTSARDTPEMKIRQLLKDAETAVEKKDATSLRQLISEKYTDSQGQNKKNIEAVLRYYFLRPCRVAPG